MYLMQENHKNKDSHIKLDLRFVYNTFSGFIHRYLPNFY